MVGMQVAEGLRARKKRETRAALVRAALELCERHGVEDVTVAQIADAAGVSRRTFFNYFASRDEAILGGKRQWAGALVAALADRPDDEDPWTAVRRAFRRVFADRPDEPEREWMARARLVRDHPSLIAQQRADMADLERRLLAELTSHGEHDRLGHRLVVATALAAVRVAVDHWVTAPDDGSSLADTVDDALGRVGAGLAT